MTAPPVKKACDACHRRKVRCSGGQPCRNCGTASLHCTYLAIPQKKGPKGSRAKVITEIRDNQHQTQNQAQNRQKSSTTPPELNRSGSYGMESNPFDFSSPPMSPLFSRDTVLLTNGTIENCYNFFFTHMYPTMPILNRPQLNEMAAAALAGSPEHYCLVASLCAFVLIQPGMTLPVTPGGTAEIGPPQGRHAFAASLLEDTIRVRKSFDFLESPTLISCQTSFFLHGSYFGMERWNSCWAHLRQATTMALLMGMHEEPSYLVGDAIENVYRRRTYWLLLVTERAYGMERHLPLSLHATIELPTIDEDPLEATALSGFLYLIYLFRVIDDEFMGLWNKSKTECSTQWLSQLQQQLLEALPPDLNTTENQAADIKVTQQWLRTMVWQLSIANGYLSSNSADSSMTFKYPIVIAKDLISDIQKLSLESMEVHGAGLIEKLFDVACTLTDVIACVPLDDGSDAAESPTEYLNQFLNLISRLRNGASRYLPLLLAKVSENLPSMAAPIHGMPLSIKSLPSDGTPSAIPGSSSGASIKGEPGGSVPFSSMSALGFSDRGLMFDAYSPSAPGSDLAMTPPLGTPQGFAHSYLSGPILAPIPRSMPSGNFHFDGYGG